MTTVTASDVDSGAVLTYSLAGGADAAKFAIDADTGVLTFIAAPNFEVPSDIGGNNVFDVVVQVSDGALTDSQAIAVTITNQNEAPTITSNGGGPTAAISLAENGTAVTTVTATDVDSGAVLTYSLAGGADAAKFAIDANTGVLTFIAAPDFDLPGDAGGNNVYDVIVQTSDGALADTQTLTVTVTNLNEAPVIQSNGGGANAAISMEENGTAVTTVAALDPDSGTTLTYSLIGGADMAKFTINATTGVLTFIAAPNFEVPSDVGGNNVFDVVVQVTDGALTDSQAIAVTITNQNEAPTITSNGGGPTAAISLAENGTAVTTVTASDVDSGSVLTYSLAGGADAAKFAIDANTGVLTFIAAPDFDLPGDAGGNNVYDVIVQTSDGALADTQTLTVTVTNLNEAPVIQSNGGGANAAISMEENGTAVTTVAALDPDSGTTLTYSLIGGADMAKFTINATTGVLTFIAAPNFEVPSDVGGNNVFDVVVQVTDGALTDSQAIAVTITNQNEAPTITSNGGGPTAAISLAENGTAVTTVTASDVDSGAVLTYSLAGGADAAKFSIDANTGVLTFIAAPDFDLPGDAGGNNVYDVIVQTSDGALADTQTLAITVTNLNEAPVIQSNGGGSVANIDVAENTSAVTTVVGVDFDAGSVLTYSLAGGLDASKFIIDATTGVLSFRIAPNFEFRSDVGANGIFNVNVRVSDGTFFDVQSLAVTVTNANDLPSIRSNGGGAGASISILENTTSVTTVDGQDEDVANVLIYSIIGGSDASKFNINALTGVLSFKSAPDFEQRTDSGGNNVYDVTVQVSDGIATDSQSIAVTVTNVAEAPTITYRGGGNSAAVTVDENGKPVGTIAAVDQDAGTTLTYTIIGGADAAMFTINALTGALRFVDAPDFETPGDVGGNNVYDVIVQVSDGSLTDSQSIAVTVANVGGRTINGTANADLIDATHTVVGQPLPSVEGDVLSGRQGNDTLDGGLGVDTLNGGLGNDTFIIQDVGDVASELAGQGTDLVRASVSFTIGAEIENLTLTGAVGLSGTGNAKANLMIGSSGNDTLIGLVGADTLDGGLGADRMVGGNAGDRYLVDNAGDLTIETAGGGVDTVVSSVNYTIGSNIENLTLVGASAVQGDGNALANAITGNAQSNTLDGRNGNDTLVGMNGADLLLGGNNNDVLNGGLGTDTLTGGGGSDVFLFTSIGDSAVSAATRDIISDFGNTDHIDISAIDADSLVAGVQQFVLDADGSFSTGEIGLTVSGADLIVRLNVDGDAAAEFTLLVQGVASLNLGDFIL